MKYRKDNHRIQANPEVHRKRKAARDCASNIAEYNWIAFRRGRSSGEGLLDFDGKFLAKAGALFIIADCCILELAFRSTPEDDPKRHRPKRDRTEALTSSHGTTSSGNASSSATRRSNSARWPSVRGKALASAQMLAHISSTSASLSSTLSRSMPKVLTDTPMVTSTENINLARARGRCPDGYYVCVNRRTAAERSAAAARSVLNEVAPPKGPYKTPNAGSSTVRLRSSHYFLNQGERDRHLHTRTI